MTSKKQKIIICIDGFNLHYGINTLNQFYKWLDLEALAKSFVKSDNAIISVKYFTSKLNGNDKSTYRQKIYLDALSKCCNIKSIMGNFTKARKCKHCNVKNNEEKQTDVNIAKSSDKLKQRINDNFQAFSLNNKEIKEQAEKALKNGDEFIGILENIWDLTAFGYGSIKFQKNKTSIRCLRQ